MAEMKYRTQAPWYVSAYLRQLADGIDLPKGCRDTLREATAIVEEYARANMSQSAIANRKANNERCQDYRDRMRSPDPYRSRDNPRAAILSGKGQGGS